MFTQAEIRQLVETKTPNEIKDYIQRLGLKTWEDNFGRGTEECATGVGKTKIALLAVEKELKINPDALIYIVVPTVNLRDKAWPEEMEKWGLEHIASNPNVRRICYTSLLKTKPERDVDLIILDEVHHLSSKMKPFFVSIKYKVFKVLGLTATLPSGSNEDDLDKMAIINELCPSVFKIDLETAIQLKLVSPFNVDVLLFDLDNKKLITGSDKQQRTEQSEYNRLTKMMKKCAWMPKLAGAKFKWIQARTMFLMNLETKQRIAKEIIASLIKDDGKRTLIFCGSIEQTEALCGENVYHSKTDDSKLIDFCDKKISYLGVVKAVNEGTNIEDLDQALIIQLSSKELAVLQRIGREIRFRPGHEARIIVAVARRTADEKWYRTAFKNIPKHRITEHYVEPTT